MKLAIASLLIVHGLITTAMSTGAFRPSQPIANPSWLNWWPTGFGESWLLVSLKVGGSPVSQLLGVAWLAGGLLLVGSGLALLDILLPSELWRQLAVAGGVVSLATLVIYLHPFYAIGIGASTVILIALLVAQWPSIEMVGF